jgi:hypothetical protein
VNQVLGTLCASIASRHIRRITTGALGDCKSFVGIYRTNLRGVYTLQQQAVHLSSTIPRMLVTFPRMLQHIVGALTSRPRACSHCF